MNHDAADLAMFWVGALFVFTPIVFFGVILGVWWFQRRRDLPSLSVPPPCQGKPQREDRDP